MTHRLTPLERAFELAQSGTCHDVSAIKVSLLSEGYSTAQLTGPSLIRQLRTLCASNRPAVEDV